MDVSMHYFFVPNRILWDNWEKFITDANSNIVAPNFTYNPGWPNAYPFASKFLDYMGVPPTNSSGTPTNINMLPIAAYQAIYNEYYRDQNLIPPIDYKLKDGANVLSNSDVEKWFTIRKRAWEHDYFTSALPFAQKGAAVDIPLGQLNGDAGVYINSPSGTQLTGTPNNVTVNSQISGDVNAGQLFADTSGISVANTTINDLRRAYRLQEWLEKNARGGTRYVESILSHFGVKSSDARLQRPEYITGVKSPVIVSEVLNTTGQTTGLPQGNMAGHGISVSTGKSGSYYCEEHGYIIGIMSVMPTTAYQQGIPRTYLKNDTLDYFWPTFANIGEQEVQNQELFAYTESGSQTFGYVPRYAEYKYMPSRVAGDFRSTLDYWHLGRIFQNQPNLNKEFVECNPTSTTRIFAVEDGTDPLYCHVYNKIHALRPMPKFGTPTI
jgi:hypothetical protein